MLWWVRGFEVFLDKVRTAITLTREAFHRDVLEQLGASSSHDDEARWLSHVAVKCADEQPDRSEDLEGLFHLFVDNRPDPEIIDDWIRRSTEGQSMRLLSKRKITFVLNFLREGIPLHSVIDTASAKSDND